MMGNGSAANDVGMLLISAFVMQSRTRHEAYGASYA